MKLLSELNNVNKQSKIKLIQSATGMELDVIDYTLSPQYTYWVKYTESIDLANVEEPTDELFILLDRLKDRTITGNLANEAVNVYITSYGLLLGLILSRRLQCGTGVSVVNLAKPGFIPTFDVQLAKSVPMQDVKFPVSVQIKYDGVRIITIIRNSIVTFYTRNGNVILMSELNSSFSGCADMVYDGELIMRPTAGVKRNRKELAGIVNRARKLSMANEDIVKYMVFDALTLEEWDNKLCTVNEDTRRRRLTVLYDHTIRTGWRSVKIVDGIAVDSTEKEVFRRVAVVEGFTVNRMEDAESEFRKVLAMGEEGLILKDPHGHYTFNRTKAWIKMKTTKSMGLKCVGILPGKSKFVGLIGALLCKGKADNGEEITVSVGTGLTMEDRERDDSYYIGETIEIAYNEAIQDSSLNWSLFLPRFVSVRFDK